MFVEAAFTRRPNEPPGRWNPDQAERWMRYLARRLHENRTRDLAWWRLSDQLLSRWAAPTVGLGLGIVFVLVAFGAALLEPTDDYYHSADIMYLAVMPAAPMWVASILVWYALPERPPGRLSLTRRGVGARFLRGAVVGSGVAAFPVGVGLIGTWSDS
jgi:hypothetical protein